MTAGFAPLTGRDRDFLELVLPAASTGKLDAVRAYLEAEPHFLETADGWCAGRWASTRRPHSCNGCWRPDERGETPLFDAVRHGRVDAVARLLEAGADVTHRNRLDQDVTLLARRSTKRRAADVLARLTDG